MKNRNVVAILYALVVPIAAIAQIATSELAFEVASIKPNAAGGNMIEVTPGRLTITSATLATCIKWAYGVQESQISPATSAVSDLLNERYDIVAKSTVLVPDGQLKLMLQNLLAGRFKLVLRKQSQEMRVYWLVVSKNGPKLRESQGEGESKQQVKSKLARQWNFTNMAQFAAELSDAMEAPVLDQTGLLAKYDFSLDLTPYLPTTGERPDIASMMVTAIQEQLGLKVESRRAPVDVLVVDHLEKPAEN
jgi:uncharacterized protein (TIGR03435 family)